MWQAFFNVILRDLGVEGIKVQELFALDEGMMAHLPCVQPSYLESYAR